MLARLTTAQLRTLLLFPEEALTSDLPNLVWFNLDYPANSTVTDAAAVDPVALLRASLHHFKKVMDAKLATLTPVQQALVRELVRCVEEGREIKVSPYCPYYDLVEDGVLSVERMAQAVARTVHENLALPREDWVRTEVYARECLDDSQ